METKRQRQVAETVKRHFTTVLQQEGGYIYGSATLVTVTEVKMTPDLGIAKIYLSVFNREDKPNVILELESNYHRLRQTFGQRVRKHMRRIPNLSFYLDETLDEMYRLNAGFDRLHAEDTLRKIERKAEEE